MLASLFVLLRVSCPGFVSLWVATGVVPARFALLEFDPAMLDNVGTVWLDRGVTVGELELLEEEEHTLDSRSFEEFEGEEVVGCFEVIRGCFEEEEPELADDCFAEDELDGSSSPEDDERAGTRCDCIMFCGVEGVSRIQSRAA